MTLENDGVIGSLSHLRIVEYGDMPAAYVTRWLGDLGADIIKVEPPGGDPNRMLAPFANQEKDIEHSLPFLNANINKRSIVLDLEESESDRVLFLDIIRSADGLVESTKPGTLQNIGLSQETLLNVNPKLVTTSITPFGQTGPYSKYKGSHAVIEALAGFMSAHGDDKQPPVVTPNHITYQVASVHGSYLTLAGIRHARLTGKGQQIDQSIQESITYMGSSALARYTDRSEIVERIGAKPQGGASNIFKCKDGKYIYISIYILPHWHKITREWMNDPVLSGDEWDDAQYRGDNGDVINILLQSFIEQFDAKDFVQECQDRGLPCAPVNTPGEFMNSEQLKYRNWIQKVSHPILGEYEAPGFLFKMEKTPMRVWRHSPTLGEHQKEIINELPDIIALKSDSKNLKTEDSEKDPMLKGIRVADLTRFFAGPIGTMFLGFYGAEIIKLESELLVANREQVLYPDMNRNKLSATLDLRNKAAKTLLDKLLTTSDVIIDNFSPRVINKLGFGWDHVKEINPGIIQITAPGMGLDGPLTDWVTWGNQLVAYTGLSHMWAFEESEMDAHGKLVVPDYLGASLVALSSLSALEYRDRTGIGQFIELAQVEAQGAIMGPSILDATVNNNQWDAMGFREILGAEYSPYGAYQCKGSDEWIIIAVSTNDEWEGLLKALGNPSWSTTEKFSSKEQRKNNNSDLDIHLNEWTMGYTPHQAMRILQSNGVPAGAVLNGEQLYSDVHLRARGHIVSIDKEPWGNISHQGLPGIPQLSEAHADGPVPWIGDDNAYVFGEILGMTNEEIEASIKLGAIK